MRYFGDCPAHAVSVSRRGQLRYGALRAANGAALLNGALRTTDGAALHFEYGYVVDGWW